MVRSILKNNLFKSLVFTALCASTSHPSRGPQGYALIQLDFNEWIIFSCINFLLFYFIIFPFFERRRKVSFICPKCEDVKDFSKKETEKKVCLNCQVEMVPIEGFYENKRQIDKELN